ARPYKPEEWSEVVKTGIELIHDNNLVLACTLIMGVPEETKYDLIKTIELIEDLKDFRSLIVPLFFVPMGKLKDEGWFKETENEQVAPRTCS
nr:radical SAM protein [Candidatus Freyarchaeota archaeon]